MRKFMVLFMVLVIALMAFSFGCSKEDGGKKMVSSRPVTAVEQGAQSAEQDVVETQEPEVVEDDPEPAPVSGQAFCEQLSGSDISGVLGGDWSKVDDCPQRPQMPAGVDVCRCDYDGPRQVYVNVETQLYDDPNEAERVYNMYCTGTAEESEVGTYSCRVPRSDELRPNYVYFLKGSHFVKVSCLGGSCPMDAIVELARKVEAEI